MAYCVYEKDSTLFVRVLKKGYWQNAIYKTEGAAKAALTRFKKDNKVINELAIAELGHFHAKIEKKRKTRNLLNPKGGDIYIPVNTPNYMDPGSEAYHSM